MDKKEIGKNIKLIRQKKGLTREELAKKLNISYSSIEKHEQGLRGFKIDTINRFAEALGVSIEELITNCYDKSKYELEKALLNGSSDVSILVSNFENSAKEESVRAFRNLIDILDWKEFRNVNDDDIYEVINSEELYSYINFLFFKKLNNR